MTIEQQLQAFAADPVVDGVRWKDGTTYSRGNKQRIPKVFTSETTAVRISVAYGHLYDPDSFVFQCHDLGFDKKSLIATTPADACREALKICRERVAELGKALGVVADVGKQTEQPPIPEWIVKYALAGHRSSAGVATKFLYDRLINQPVQGAKEQQ